MFSFAVMAVYLIFYREISVLLFGSTEKYIIQILSISLPFAVLMRYNELLIRMKERAKLYSFIQIMIKLVNLALVVIILLFFNRNFKGVIQAQFYSTVIMAVITTFINIKEWKYRFSLNKALMKKIISFGLPLIPTSIMMWLLNSMDKIALRKWAGFETIGLYSAAFKIVSVISIIQVSFSTFWAPTSFRWYEEKVSYKKFEKVSNKLDSVLSLVFAFVVLFRNQIIMILSPEYKNAVVIVPFLLFYPVMYTLSESTTMGINFSRKTYYNILVTAVAGGANIIGNIMLVPKYGALGASVSTGLSYIIFFWMRTLISRSLWEKFAVKKHFISTCVMVIMATFSVLFNNFYIDVVMFLIIVMINVRDIKWGIGLIKSLFIKE